LKTVPLAVRRPWKCRPYQLAMPCWDHACAA
jgi:hypothetical protein